MSTSPVTASTSRSTRVRLFFDQTSDEQFLVLAEVLSSPAPGVASQFSLHTFQHEDRFLERLIAADLPLDDTSLLAGTVIRTVGQSGTNRNWMEVDLTDDQIDALGLHGERLFTPPDALPPASGAFDDQPPYHFADNSSQFQRFLMQSPTPFVMLSGSEHQITFINQPYVELIGKTTRDDIMMMPIREVLPELEGQPFFGWLDEVYETGLQRVGKQQLARILRQDGGGFEDRYFDFVYYPVRNSGGQVYGVMVQAADVTEKVRAEEVAEYREDTLFRQWAEIEGIYRTAPVGMALLDAKSLRLLRVNEKQAEMMGSTVTDLIGKKALDLEFIPPDLYKLFERIGRGETIRNAIVEKPPRTAAQAQDISHRTWLVNISPFLGASGEALAFTSISLEIPDEP